MSKVEKYFRILYLGVEYTGTLIIVMLRVETYSSEYFIKGVQTDTLINYLFWWHIFEVQIWEDLNQFFFDL